MVCALVHDSKHLFEFSSTKGGGQQGSTTFPLMTIFQKQPEAFSWSQREGLNTEREKNAIRDNSIYHIFLTFNHSLFNSFLSTFLDWKFSKSLTKTSFSKSGSLTERTGVYPSKYLRIKEKNVVNHKHTFLVPRYTL